MSNLCKNLYDAVVLINDKNTRLRKEYNEKRQAFEEELDMWEKDYSEWEKLKEENLNKIAATSTWVEVEGKSVDCSSLGKDTTICCPISNLKRKKCTLQNKGGGSKCSQGGLCGWSKSCCSAGSGCSDINASYCTNGSVTGLPESESAWFKDLGNPSPPIKPVFNETLSLSDYPVLVCQDCSTSIEALKSTDVSFDEIKQASKCVSNISSTQVAESNEDIPNGEMGEINGIDPNGNSFSNEPSAPEVSNSDNNTNSDESVGLSYLVQLIVGIIVIILVIAISIYLSSGGPPSSD